MRGQNLEAPRHFFDAFPTKRKAPETQGYEGADARARPGRTICPTDAAMAYAAGRGEGELGWRAHLQDVKRAAIALAVAGRIVIYRKGKPVDPHDFRGVYRLGSPRSE